jgi:hypothetical protein
MVGQNRKKLTNACNKCTSEIYVFHWCIFSITLGVFITGVREKFKMLDFLLFVKKQKRNKPFASRIVITHHHR